MLGLTIIVISKTILVFGYLNACVSWLRWKHKLLKSNRRGNPYAFLILTFTKVFHRSFFPILFRLILTNTIVFLSH